jgi:hypothetical protein
MLADAVAIVYFALESACRRMGGDGGGGGGETAKLPAAAERDEL